MESVEYEPAWALGANCDNADIASIAKMIDQCNDYGHGSDRAGQRAVDVHGGDGAQGFVKGTGLAGAMPRPWWR